MVRRSRVANYHYYLDSQISWAEKKERIMGKSVEKEKSKEAKADNEEFIAKGEAILYIATAHWKEIKVSLFLKKKSR